MGQPWAYKGSVDQTRLCHYCGFEMSPCKHGTWKTRAAECHCKLPSMMEHVFSGVFPFYWLSPHSSLESEWFATWKWSKRQGQEGSWPRCKIECGHNSEWNQRSRQEGEQEFISSYLHCRLLPSGTCWLVFAEGTLKLVGLNLNLKYSRSQLTWGVMIEMVSQNFF